MKRCLCILLVIVLWPALASNQLIREISLGEVLRASVENNLNIKLQKLQVDANRFSLALTQTIFEPTLNFSSTTDSQDRSPRTLDEGDANSIITVDTTGFKFDFSKKENFGMDWKINLESDGQDSTAINSFGKNFEAQWSVGFEQKLLKGFSLDPQIRQKDEYIAKGNFQLSQLDLKLAIIDILFQTENAYWDLVNAIENQTAIQNSLNLAKLLYQKNKTMIEIGTLAPIELVFAESNMASKESELVTAENTVKQTEDILRKMMNIPDPDWDQRLKPTNSPNMDLVAVNKKEAFIKAFQNRIELTQQRINHENEQIEYRYYKNQRLPDLKLSGQYVASGVSFPPDPQDATTLDQKNSNFEALSKAFGRQFPGLNVQLAMNWTPFNKFNNIKLAEADLKLRQRALQSEQVQRNIREEIRGAIRELHSAEKSIKANEKARKFREDSLSAEVKKFQNGLTTNYQIAEAQDELTLSISKEISARIAYRKALVQYYKSIGLLEENSGIRID